MKKLCTSTILALLFVSSFLCRDGWAAKAYVNDAHEIALRSGPSVQNRVIRMLAPGTPVDSLNTKNDWTQIRLPEGSGNVREGWVLSRFLSVESPESMQQRGLEQENTNLKGLIEALEKEKAEFVKREKEQQEKLNQLDASYNSLKSGSTNYLKFKEEFDATKAALAAAQANYQSLQQENENLRLSQKIKWFAAGAIVLLAGWALGLLTGRLQKKRRSTYRI
jgi:SH3 domain protein